MERPDFKIYIEAGLFSRSMEKHLLILLRKNGEDEYDAMEMLRYGVVIERLEDREELTEEYLAELDRKHEPDRVVIEYNGMWKSVILKI